MSILDIEKLSDLAVRRDLALGDCIDYTEEVGFEGSHERGNINTIKYIAT
jgi:hypothetical protein